MIFERISKVILIACCLLLTVSSGARAEGTIYNNETMGIVFAGPEGWYMDIAREDGPGVIRVIFSKHDSFLKKALPRIILSTEPIGAETGFTPDEFAERKIEALEETKKLSGADSFRVIQGKADIVIGGKEGVLFGWEAITASGGKIRHSDYVFKKGGHFYIISCQCSSDSYEEEAKSFAPSVSTFRMN